MFKCLSWNNIVRTVSPSPGPPQRQLSRQVIVCRKAGRDAKRAAVIEIVHQGKEQAGFLQNPNFLAAPSCIHFKHLGWWETRARFTADHTKKQRWQHHLPVAYQNLIGERCFFFFSLKKKDLFHLLFHSGTIIVVTLLLNTCADSGASLTCCFCFFHAEGV